MRKNHHHGYTKGMDNIVLGGGCFWCLEAAYQLIDGVVSVTSGYAGGKEPDPTYYDVAYGRTHHAEVVKIEFDANTISLEDILEIFWTIHDPTTPDRQGNDVGPQYRSIILYWDDRQKAIIKTSKQIAAKYWDNSIVTEVALLEKFYPAEPEHQNYFKNHPEQAYCQVIINPKLQKLKEKFASRIKSDGM